MLSDINLISQNEVVEQQKTKAVKGSTVFALIILLLVILFSAYCFITVSGIKAQMSKLDGSITSLRGKIQGLSEVEIASRNLSKRYRALQGLFSQRPKYSLLLNELKARKPDDIDISSLDVSYGRMNISGSSTEYITIADFINSLLNKDFSGGNPNLKGLFTEVILNSVSLEKATNTMNFFIVVSYDMGKLK